MEALFQKKQKQYIDIVSVWCSGDCEVTLGDIRSVGLAAVSLEGLLQNWTGQQQSG